MNELDRYGLVWIVGFLFAVFALATSGCSSRRLVRMEADEITIQGNVTTVLSNIPAMEAKGLRLWIAAGDKGMNIPDGFFVYHEPVAATPDELLKSLDDGEMTLWKPYGEGK